MRHVKSVSLNERRKISGVKKANLSLFYLFMPVTENGHKMNVFKKLMTLLCSGFHTFSSSSFLLCCSKQKQSREVCKNSSRNISEFICRNWAKRNIHSSPLCVRKLWGNFTFDLLFNTSFLPLAILFFFTSTVDVSYGYIVSKFEICENPEKDCFIVFFIVYLPM